MLKVTKYLMFFGLASVLAGCNWTELVSVSSTGEQGNGWSYHPSASSDGRYVAFSSNLDNLIADDTNGTWDVFVRDTLTGTTTRVSVNSDEVQGNSSSSDSRISGDGRYVAFKSFATNLVPGDTNNSGQSHIFVRDTVAGTTTRISVDSDEGQANSSSGRSAVSADGRYVAFESGASNLIADDTNGTQDIFVRDVVAGTTTRASLGNLGTEANGRSYLPSISSDSRYVAFVTEANNLVPGDTNSEQDVIIRAIPQVTITSVIPDHLPIGETTSVTVTGTNFLPGAIPFIGSLPLSNIVVVDENTITMDVTVPYNQPDGAQDFLVGLPGTGPGLLTGAVGTCTDCVTIPPGC